MNYYNDVLLSKRFYDGMSTAERDRNLMYNFVILRDPSGTFEKVPGFHPKATKKFKDHFKKHPLILKQIEKMKNVEFHEFRKGNYLHLPKEDYYLVTNWDGSKKKKTQAPKKRKASPSGTPK